MIARLNVSLTKLTGKFALGRTVMTAAARATIPLDDIVSAMTRHADGDWGELDAEDWDLNERALQMGERLFSRYHARDGTLFYIITEADRSVTTVLLPEDY